MPTCCKPQSCQHDLRPAGKILDWVLNCGLNLMRRVYALAGVAPFYLPFVWSRGVECECLARGCSVLFDIPIGVDIF